MSVLRVSSCPFLSPSSPVLVPPPADAGVIGAGGVNLERALRLRGAPVVEEGDCRLGGLDLGQVGLRIEVAGSGERRLAGRRPHRRERRRRAATLLRRLPLDWPGSE